MNATPDDDILRPIRMSLWLRPGGTALQALTGVIEQCSGVFGGEKPNPHVSLLGGIALPLPAARELLSQFAGLIEAPSIRLSEFDSRKDEYYRCWFLRAEPACALGKLQGIAGELFRVSSDGPFEPHLSLAYGNFDAALGQQLGGEFASLRNLSFEPASVDLVAASGELPVADWAILASVPLRTARPAPQDAGASPDPALTGVIP